MRRNEVWRCGWDAKFLVCYERRCRQETFGWRAVRININTMNIFSNGQVCVFLSLFSMLCVMSFYRISPPSSSIKPTRGDEHNCTLFTWLTWRLWHLLDARWFHPLGAKLLALWAPFRVSNYSSINCVFICPCSFSSSKALVSLLSPSFSSVCYNFCFLLFPTVPNSIWFESNTEVFI